MLIVTIQVNAPPGARAGGKRQLCGRGIHGQQRRLDAA